MIMKIKSNVLFGLIVLICSISGFSLLKRMTREIDEWRPSDLYSSSNLSRRSTFSVVSSAPASYSSAVATVSSGSGSMFRHHGASLYAPASSSPYSQSPLASSPLASSPQGGLYTTSSAEFRSFGGGGNVGGVSMSGGSVKSSNSSVATASGLNVSMPSTSMYAYNTNRSSASDVMSSMSGDIAMTSTQAYAGIGNTTRGIGGRKNAPGMGGNLDNWVQDIIGNDGWVWTDGTIDYFDKAKLYQMYQEAIANGDLPEGITWEEFLSWFGDQSDRYAFPIPSGVWFMCFLALGYGLYIAYRRKQKVVNS